MALDVDALKTHLNGVPAEDEAMLDGLLGAATGHVQRVLGFDLDDEGELPDGTPPELEQAVLMLAAHWYENREATLVGVSAQSVPHGVTEILAEHRRYTFG